MVAACFSVGSVRLCLDRAILRGVLEELPITPMAGLPPWLLGACNRGGRALAVVDVVLLAGVSACATIPRLVVVVETSAGPVGVAADAALGERRGASPTRNGDLLVQVEPGTWMLDVARLPASLDAAIHGRGPAL